LAGAAKVSSSAEAQNENKSFEDGSLQFMESLSFKDPPEFIEVGARAGMDALNRAAVSQIAESDKLLTASRYAGEKQSSPRFADFSRN
jgi:hypothetical protein